MGLCGCIGRGKNRVQQSSDAKKSYLGPRGYEKSITSAHDVDLHAYFWPAEGTLQGVVQLLHGNNTYIEFDFLKFKEPGQLHDYEGSWVEELNQRGYLVVGFDFQGFGRSKGTRAYLQRFDDYVEDALFFARLLRAGGEGEAAHEGVPHFLLGYGLGGLVGVAASLRQPGWFSGMLLVSPLLMLPQEVPESSGSIRFRSRIAPKSGVSSASDDVPVDWNEEACEKDPLVYSGKVRAGSVVSLMYATERLASEEGDPPGLACVSVPLLVFQASGDRVSEPEGARELVQRAATHDKQLRTVSSSCHALLKDEANSRTLLDEAAEWLGRQCRSDRTKGLFPRAPAGGPPGGQAPLKASKLGDDDGDNDTDNGPAKAEAMEAGAAGKEALVLGAGPMGGGLPGAVDGGHPAAGEEGPAGGPRGSLGGLSDASKPGRPPSLSEGLLPGLGEPDDVAGGGANDAAARMAALALEDDDGVYGGPPRGRPSDVRAAPEPALRNPSQRSRGSSGSAEPARGADWDARRADDDDDVGGGRQDEAGRLGGASSRGQGLGGPPYGGMDGREEDDRDAGTAAGRGSGGLYGGYGGGGRAAGGGGGGMDDDEYGIGLKASEEREAARRWDEGTGGGTKDFFTAYGGGGAGGGGGPSRRGLPPRNSFGDGEDDTDPFAGPPSPRPQPAAPPPSSLPPLGPSRFAPLPPIGFQGH